MDNGYRLLLISLIPELIETTSFLIDSYEDGEVKDLLDSLNVKDEDINALLGTLMLSLGSVINERNILITEDDSSLVKDKNIKELIRPLLPLKNYRELSNSSLADIKSIFLYLCISLGDLLPNEVYECVDFIKRAQSLIQVINGLNEYS